MQDIAQWMNLININNNPISVGVVGRVFVHVQGRLLES